MRFSRGMVALATAALAVAGVEAASGHEYRGDSAAAAFDRSAGSVLLRGVPVFRSDEALRFDGKAGDDGNKRKNVTPTSREVDLVGKLKLTNVDGGIADVGYHEGFAYLNAFSPECVGRPGAAGTGVHIVDATDPSAPSKVGFIPAETNSYVGEGVHVIEFGGRDILLHNNETCDANQTVVSGVSAWDVTNPRTPVRLGQFGDTTPAQPRQTYHTTHSVQGFTWKDRAYAVASDNQDLKDVDIFDITALVNGTGPAVLASETGLEDYSGAQGSFANGDTVFHHDMQQKVIDGRNRLAVSYWDAGQVVLDIDDPAAPLFLGDSDYANPDPEYPAFQQPEGNSHQSYYDQDGEWLISTDEDFSPTRTAFAVTDGPDAGPYGAGQFSFTKPIPEGGITSTKGSIFGGSGCPSDQNSNGLNDNTEVPSAASTGAEIAVFSRGGCFFSDKIRAGEDAGYAIVLVGQSHGGTRGGLLTDGFICGSQGSPVLGTAYGVCVGHRVMHTLFGDTPAYTAPEGYTAGGDLPAIGTKGGNISAATEFDGWGYVNLHDARNADLPIVDTYAVAESKDPARQTGFGNLTVHEVKTDARKGKDLAYFSYYAAGLRVASFGKKGLKEVGHFNDGNDFWGVVPVCEGRCAKKVDDDGDGDEKGSKDKATKRPLLFMSDRDEGLYILRYTGKE